MTGVLKLTITESAEELKALLTRQTKASARERIQALYLLKIGKVKTITGLAEILGRDISTIFRWFQRYRSTGLEGLLNTPRNQGRKPIISEDVLDILKDKLQSRHQFRSYEDIRLWLKDKFGIEASYKVVHETVRYRLRTRLKTSRTR